MELQDRIKAFCSLNQKIDIHNEKLSDTISLSKQKNAWFTEDSIWQALNAIKNDFLKEEKIYEWLNPYNIAKKKETKSVGLILAGNIPLVGFHDVLSVLLSGHKALIKYSEKDNVLIPYLLEELCKIDTRFEEQITLVERLKNFDAVIATGSDISGSYFDKYFGHVPNIIRRNRNAIAVIYNEVKDESLQKLGDDLFSYYGLGCRNVSKLYIEKGFKLDRIFEALISHQKITNHNKYMNNYDYSNAMYLLNQEPYLTNNFLILRESKDLASRVSVLNYEYFETQDKLVSKLNHIKDKIQCIVSDQPLAPFKIFDFGKAQQPALFDYADDVDTMKFLCSL